MAVRKLNYIFHNPNTLEATQDMLVDVFLEVMKHKFDKELTDMQSAPLDEDLRSAG